MERSLSEEMGGWLRWRERSDQSWLQGRREEELYARGRGKKVGRRKWGKKEKRKRGEGAVVCGPAGATHHSPPKVTCGTMPRH
jgi:hypothetical protein